jgi:predicted porin
VTFKLAIRKAFPIIMVMLLAFPAVSLAIEEIDLDDLEFEIEEEDAIYTFPEIPPEGEVCAGIKYVDAEGSEQADEYEYLDSSPTFCGELRMFKYPHRAHIEVDFRSKNEYFSDIRYAHKDIVLFRALNRSLYHNLENIELIDLDTSTTVPGVDIRDSNEVYGTRVGINTYDLRLKTPDFPLHGFFKGWILIKDGTKQQISLLGSGTFNDMVRTSEERDVDYDTRRYKVGINSHLGPIEAEYSHTEKSFDAKGDVVMEDFYEASALRTEGVYPHNTISEFDGSIDSLSFHTSYTGRLVASATLTKKDSTNNQSNATADYLIGSGGIYWLPMDKMLFTAKYTYKDQDVDNPSSVSITDVTDPSNTFTYDVEQSVSSTTDKVSLTGRYSPLTRLTLKANYSYRETNRSNADDFGLESSTSKHTATLFSTARLLSSLSANAGYVHTATESPSYNTEPETSDEGHVSLTWTPLPEINTFLTYSVTSGQSDEQTIDDVDTENWESLTNNFMGMCTFLFNEDFALTVSYAYIRQEIEQDIVYESLGGAELVDPDVDLKDTAKVFAVNMDYMPKEALTLGTGITLTRSNGEFTPESEDLTEPESVESFSEYKVTETAFTINGEYKFKNGISTDVEYTYSSLSDEIDNPHDDVEDGSAHVIIVRIKKRWQ